ncbi:hypothetical protein ITX31_01105 [Arthrobacter gandavensis]|uniref:hypothetical protein n=1 Tax=Arthrobacter gandavensis TaxID=169960 RepID=UPI00188F6AB7|nr:hypothetical protein [Arthrobacter gandavensis]MBF4992710.1 hypothetical protein [Arthrobacter gandavensis]
MKPTRRIQSLFASLAGLALIASTGGAANAGPRDALAETPASVTTAAVSSERAAEVTSEAMASLASGEVDIQASLESLKASDSKVSTVSTPDGQYTTVTVPLGEPYSLTSNVSMVLDSTGHRLQYSETLVSENAAGKFNVTTYVDGTLTSNQDTDLAFMTDAELRADLANSQPKSPTSDGGMQLAEKNTGACIATVLGVGGVVGSIIAYSCAGACASAAVGVGVPFCVACIAGFATVGGASITAVATCF